MKQTGGPVVAEPVSGRDAGTNAWGAVQHFFGLRSVVTCQ